MSLTDCNLVLKGGVTSGLVHAGALPELAKYYRFRGVAGSSAGAIAAAFSAAAEFARRRGDPEAFERLHQHSADLPSRLLGLFQPSPGLERLMSALIFLAPGTGRARVLRVAFCFWPGMITGVVLVAAVWIALTYRAGPAAMVFGGLALGAFGAIAGLGLQLAGALRRAVSFNFGLCTGLSRGDQPALTDWIHACLQDIAFGSADRRRPLTFGDLESESVELRIATTNLFTGRSEVTPRLGQGRRFRVSEWSRLFPDAVVQHLAKVASDDETSFPSIPDLPVLVAVRMSLACPGLMEAVPALTHTGARIWYSDGGLTTNFPFDVFNDDPRPTLGLDLDTLQTGEDTQTRVRRFDPDTDNTSPNLNSLRGFVWSLLVALREGHLRTSARRPETRARIYQARLAPDEGGMKLDMTPEEAVTLMRIGAELGALVIDSELGRAT